MKNFIQPIIIALLILLVGFVSSVNRTNKKELDRLNQQVEELQAKVDYCENPILSNLE